MYRIVIEIPDLEELKVFMTEVLDKIGEIKEKLDNLSAVQEESAAAIIAEQEQAKAKLDELTSLLTEQPEALAKLAEINETLDTTIARASAQVESVKAIVADDTLPT